MIEWTISVISVLEWPVLSERRERYKPWRVSGDIGLAGAGLVWPESSGDSGYNRGSGPGLDRAEL